MALSNPSREGTTAAVAPGWLWGRLTPGEVRRGARGRRRRRRHAIVEPTKSPTRPLTEQPVGQISKGFGVVVTVYCN